MPSFKEITLNTIGGVFTSMGAINASTHGGTPGLVSLANWLSKYLPTWLQWIPDFFILVGNNFVYAVGITMVGVLLLFRRNAIVAQIKRFMPGKWLK